MNNETPVGAASVEIDGELVLRPVIDAAVSDGWDDVRGILHIDDVDADIEEMRGR